MASHEDQRDVAAAEEKDPVKPNAGLAAHAEKTTSAYTDFIVHHPYVMAMIMLGFTLIMVVLWTSVVNTGNQKAGASGGQFLAIGDLDVQRYLAELQSEKRTSTLITPVQLQTDKQMQLIVMFQTGSGANVFSPAMLRQMYAVEQQITGQQARGTTSITGYADNCQLEYRAFANGTVIEPAVGCLAPVSPLSQIFFRNRTYNSTDVEALTQTQINQQLATWSEPALAASLGLEFFFANDFYTNGNASSITRASFTFGVPLSLLNSDGSRKYLFYNTDNDVDQWKDHEKWVVQYTDLFDASDPNFPNSDLNIYYIETILSGKEVGDRVQQDLQLAFAAIAGVYLLMLLFTGSVFYTTAGILNVLMSYPIALALFHGLLQIEISTQLNQMALFVILGVGADDIFVFVDAWKQSLQEDEALVGTPEKRLYWAWRRASLAMLVTSATTFFAFLMTATSPIPTISTFGIIAALMVISMYGLVVSWFPACVIIGLRWNIDDFSWSNLCCRCCNKAENKDPSASSTEMVTATKVDVKEVNVKEAEVIKSEPVDHDAEEDVSRVSASGHKTASHVEDISDTIHQYRRCERIFYQQYAPFIFKYRYGVLGLFAVLFVLALVGALSLQTPNQLASGLPDGTELKKALDRLELFPVSGGVDSLTFSAYMYLGIDEDNPVDRSGIDKNDEDRFGRLNLVPGFTLNNATLNHVASICARLRSAVDSNGNVIVTEGGLRCFTDALIPYLQSRPDSNTLFATEASVAAAVRDFIYVPDANGDQSNLKYEKDIGGVEDPNPVRVTWVRVAGVLPIDINPQRSEMANARASWVREADAINDSRPAGQTKVMPTSIVFAWRATFDLLISNTYLSIVTQFAVSVVVLFVTSRNWIVAGFASLSIAGVVLSVLAVFVAAGSKLDFIEAVVALMLVGLSVDYVVHYANSYNETQLKNRYTRTRAALLEMGISVTEGALTTLVASFFLMFAAFPFFRTFGQFVFATICLSYLWANGFFMTCLVTWGPDRHPAGDIIPLILPLYQKVRTAIVGDTSNSEKSLSPKAGSGGLDDFDVR